VIYAKNVRRVALLRRWSRVLVALAIGACAVSLPASANAVTPPVNTVDTSGIVPIRSGDVQIVDPVRRGTELQRGGSSTEFTLEPPAASQCPGDSEHDSWRVQTFMVPADVDPGTLVYVIGPNGEGQYPVFDKFTEPYVDRLTIANDSAGLPARIDALPPMNFAVFPPGLLPDGTYRIGIACSYFSATANYWDTQIIITSSPDDEPAQFVWRLAGAPATVPDSDSDQKSRLWLVPVLAGVAGLGGWFVWNRNRRNLRTTDTASTTHNTSNTRNEKETVSLSKEPQ
jgi:hypothetical protein